MIKRNHGLRVFEEIWRNRAKLIKRAGSIRAALNEALIPGFIFTTPIELVLLSLIQHDVCEYVIDSEYSDCALSRLIWAFKKGGLVKSFLGFKIRQRFYQENPDEIKNSLFCGYLTHQSRLPADFALTPGENQLVLICMKSCEMGSKAELITSAASEFDFVQINEPFSAIPERVKAVSQKNLMIFIPEENMLKRMNGFPIAQLIVPG